MTREWDVKAECKKHDANLFSSPEGRGTALHICRAHCPVRVACRQWAHEQGGWDRQTIGGEWWVVRKGYGTKPTDRHVDSETTFCKTCNPAAPPLPPPVDQDAVPCGKCHRSVGVDVWGNVAWHLEPGAVRGGESCVGSGAKPWRAK